MPLLSPRKTLKFTNYADNINDLQSLVTACFDIPLENQSNFWWFAHILDKVSVIFLFVFYYTYNMINGSIK